MLFNSYLFIFLFLPIALSVYFFLGRNKTPVAQMVWIAFWSCVFYAYWKPIFLLLLMTSVCVNYSVACSLMKNKSKVIFTVGIIFNILVIAYFKYKGFLLENFNALTSSHLRIHHLALPLGISFITFQKIAYLVDVYRGKVVEKNFLRYLVFISFFPQLIAGPIVHYNPLMSQFSHKHPKKLRYENMAVGLTLFTIGLAKKVLLADTLASYADSAFSAGMASVHLTFFESWVGVLAYTFQIYFDFSGYSDMAIGLARMFGVRLPINFNSPYKSANIIDFWRRWHITLSHFLRDYVYIPLGGNRKGELRKFVNLMATMLIGGLWHGANWTFVIWGGIHGALLTMNHLWVEACEKLGWHQLTKSYFYKLFARSATFIAVAFAWVFFRMQSLGGAKFILKGMIGVYGLKVSENSYLFHVTNRLSNALVDFGYHPDPVLTPALFLFFIMGLIWFLPNSQQLMRYRNRWEGIKALQFLIWKPRAIYLLGTMALFYASLVVMLDFKFKPFAYFAF